MLKLFCVLVGAPGVAFVVTINAEALVGKLMAEIKERRPITIRCDPSELKLYLARRGDTWLPSNDPLVPYLEDGDEDDEELQVMMTGKTPDPEMTIRQWLAASGMPEPGTSKEIHVLVRAVEREMRIDMNQAAAARLLEPYVATAKLLRDHEVVQRLGEYLAADLALDEEKPFVALESSSGMGKTQMAFNLDASGLCEVFYIPCTPGGDRDQAIHEAFQLRSESFFACIDADMELLLTGSVNSIAAHEIYLYGFVAAAIRGDPSFRGPARRSTVLEAIRDRMNRGIKPLVFFLDDFPYLRSRPKNREEAERVKYVQTMRNVFRSLPVGVVISATNGTARDLVVPGEQSTNRPLFPWCLVFPSLPTVANREFENLGLPTTMVNILKHSRPLFVKLALEHVQMNPYDGHNVWDYMDNMVDCLALEIKSLTNRLNEFELGQLALFLSSSYEVIDGKEYLINGHFARLRELEPFQLKLGSEFYIGSKRWTFRCVIPKPDEDLLLHLCMAGGRSFRPLSQPLHAMIKPPSARQLIFSNHTPQEMTGRALKRLWERHSFSLAIAGASTEWTSQPSWVYFCTSWAYATPTQGLNYPKTSRRQVRGSLWFLSCHLQT